MGVAQVISMLRLLSQKPVFSRDGFLATGSFRHAAAQVMTCVNNRG